MVSNYYYIINQIQIISLFISPFDNFIAFIIFIIIIIIIIIVFNLNRLLNLNSWITNLIIINNHLSSH